MKKNKSLSVLSTLSVFSVVIYKMKSVYQRLIPLIHFFKIPDCRCSWVFSFNYPINGDGDTDLLEVLDGILKKRHDLRSSTGNLNYNSPENKDEVCNFIGKLNGTMEPVLHVRYPGSSVPSKITMDSIIENTEIPVADDDTKNNIMYIIEVGKKNNKISYASKKNTEIYEENCKKIVPFIKK